MTSGEKELFCAFAAALLAPPDATLVDDLQQDKLRARLDAYVQAWRTDTQLLRPFFQEPNRDDFLSALRREYVRLFDQHDGEKISLVESTYKPWTSDKSCGMAFGVSKGLLMGDCAVHMLDLYQQSAIEIPEEFRSTPDHLVLELEFLGLLYQNGSEEQTKQFIEDHLDWIPDLKREMERSSPDAFYRNSIQLIHLFLESEVTNGKVNAHG